MAQSSFPFENVDTTETQFSQMFRTLNAGVNGTPAGTELKVSAGTGLQVSVALGQAMVRGHYYISTATELLTIGTANPSNPRIDTVVLRLDPVANSIVLAVVAGTAAASPVAPTLTQTDAGVFEFPLANVAVAAGAGTVGAITDRRVFMGKRLQSVGTSAARDIVFPAPVQGDMVWRDDLGALETYYGLYNASTNPGGRTSAGWYVSGRQTGLLPVRPSSVVIASGSGAMSAINELSFSGATSISMNGVFTSAFKNYKILINIDGITATTNLKFRTRLNGVDESGSIHNQGGTIARANGTGSYAAASVNDAQFYLNFMQSGFVGTTELTVFAPQISILTSLVSKSLGQETSSVSAVDVCGTQTSVRTADGFTIFNSAGTIGGTVTVYGFNN